MGIFAKYTKLFSVQVENLTIPSLTETDGFCYIYKNEYIAEKGGTFIDPLQYNVVYQLSSAILVVTHGWR